MANHIVGVTGAGGFLGSAVCTRLSSSPSVKEVRALFSSPPSTLPSKVVPFVGGLEDPMLASKLVEGCDTVIHFACRGVPGDRVSNPAEMISKNCLALNSLLSAMTEKKVNRLVLSGSAGAIYRADSPTLLHEDSPLGPRSTYGISKVVEEQMAFLYQQLEGIQTMVIRLSNPYGPGQMGKKNQGIVAAAIRSLLDGTPLPLWAPLSTQKDFLFIDDAVEAFHLAMASEPFRVGIYNVGFGKPTSLAELILALEKVTGRKLALERHPSKPTDSPFAIDISKVANYLGWAPQTTLEQGLQLTWAHERERRQKTAA